MKPTEKQIRICALISAQVEFWAMAEDIFDPKYIEEIKDIAYLGVNHANLTEDESIQLEKTMIEILNFIRSIQ